MKYLFYRIEKSFSNNFDFIRVREDQFINIIHQHSPNNCDFTFTLITTASS